MPNLQILNPHDQPTGKWRLLHELRACLVDPEFDALRIAVAFAKTGPLYRLQAEIERWRNQQKTIEAIFGVDHCVTSRQALEFAMSHFSMVRLLHFGNEGTYHPKMYLFSGQRRCRFFIGSHNLTVGGTETNWESGTIMTLDLPNDHASFQEAQTAWQALISMSVNLTPALLAHFDGNGTLVDETKIPRRRSGQRTGSASVKSPPSTSGGWPTFVAKPPSAIPKSVFVKNAKTGSSTQKALKGARKSVSPTAEALVIQIVPHHNGEVFLSKIALNQNPNFFAYPFTGTTTPKKAGNPSYPQRTPDPVINLVVHGAAAGVIVHHPRLLLNTVFYTTKAEIRVTVPQDVVKNTPALSILVMRHAPPDSDYDYDFEIFPPSHPQFAGYYGICNQLLPSGGRTQARRMGWL